MITVIIPTLGTRPCELDRAIESVLNQEGVQAMPLVVLNGDKYPAELLAALRQRPGVRVHQTQAAGVSQARFQGRKLVETPFFAFLDDDDELLPGALKIRLAGHSASDVALVATSGYLQHRDERRIIPPNFARASADPAQALLDENWLSSAGGLYRTDRVLPSDLEGLPDHLEMTYLAFSMALRQKILLIDEPTFIVHNGALGQVSRTWAYQVETPKVLARMEKLTARADLRKQLQRKRAAALHVCSATALENGSLTIAWQYHLASLGVRGGLRYLAYTRRLLTRQKRDADAHSNTAASSRSPENGR